MAGLLRRVDGRRAGDLVFSIRDEAVRPGGQVYRQPPPAAARDASALYGFEARKADAIHRVVDTWPGGIDYRPRTLVWNVFGNRLDLLSPEGHGELSFDRLLLAT